MSIPTSERKALAEELGVSYAYLYQCLSGIKAMKPAEAVRLEAKSGQRLRRWQLRPNDWHLIWPELVGASGAPTAPAAQ